METMKNEVDTTKVEKAKETFEEAVKNAELSKDAGSEGDWIARGLIFLAGGWLIYILIKWVIAPIVRKIKKKKAEKKENPKPKKNKKSKKKDEFLTTDDVQIDTGEDDDDIEVEIED